MVNFGQFGDIFWYFGDILAIFWWYIGIFWQIFGYFLPFFGIFWTIYWVKIFLYDLDSWNTNIAETNIVWEWPTPISQISIWFDRPLVVDQYTTNTKKIPKKLTAHVNLIILQYYHAGVWLGPIVQWCGESYQ